MEQINRARTEASPGGRLLTGKDEREVLEFAGEAGHILLENGAEIFRVEETIKRICSHFNVCSEQLFVLSNGIFMTGNSESATLYAKVLHIPVKAARLEKVIAVNQLSREIEAGRYTLPEAKERLREIREIAPPPFWYQVAASGIGSACFCFLFGGNALDSLSAFLAGFLLYGFILKISARHLSKITSSICGGFLATAVCALCYSAGLGKNLDCMIIGGVIPLIPGIPFTNGIRDIANGDYISGSVRLLDAALSFLGIAIGVGAALAGYYFILRKFSL